MVCVICYYTDMIRTRDFILFLLILIFLVVSIVLTLSSNVNDYDGNLETNTGSVTFSSVDSSVTGASSPHNKIDRLAILKRLRTSIANGDTQITPAPSVESPLPMVSTTTNLLALKKCLATDDMISKVPQWPFSKIQVNIDNNQRVYFALHKKETPVAVLGTSTPTSTKLIKQILLQTPVTPATQNKPNCVPSEIIGVTTSGLLIFNSSVATYTEQGPQTLIGYARDGFPIYGVYQGEVDECGGYDDGYGYRYSVNPNRNFILGCYTAVPNKFKF